MSSRPPRPVVGPALVVVGAVHVAITPLVAGEGFRGIVQAGIVNAVEADPAAATARGHAFWYATTGVGLLAFGWAVTVIERSRQPVPRGLPLVLVGLGLWGIVAMPRSPFWVFPVLAGVAEVRRRSTRSTDR